MPDRDLSALVDAFAGKRVLVVGDVMLDERIEGEVRRLSPEAPVPVVEVRKRTFAPGGAANAAMNVAALEGRASVVALRGNDGPGLILRNALTDAGIDVELLLYEDKRVTTHKTRVVGNGHQLTRLDVEDEPLSETALLGLSTAVQRKLPESQAVLLSDYGKGVVSVKLAREVIAAARRLAIPVVVDPKGTDCTKYHGATVVKPNLYEAERMVGHRITNEEELLKAGRRLSEFFGGAVVVTRGADGMTLFPTGRSHRHEASVALHAVDVTGAGDTVAACLALVLADGGALIDAVRLANYAAGVVVGKPGTAAVTREELLERLAREGT